MSRHGTYSSCQHGADEEDAEMSTIKIQNRGADCCVSGASYLFRSEEAARRVSERVTTSPGVVSYWCEDAVEGNHARYAAIGDNWIDSSGKRGTSVFGRGVKLLTVVEVTS
jgi:hypothetical protein